MIMQMLEAGGVEIVADFERAADPDNPEGYYELERVKQIDGGQETAWLVDVRGRAIKIVSHYLRYLPDTNNYRVIFVHRDLAEILASQAKMLERRGETIRDPEAAAARINRLLGGSLDEGAMAAVVNPELYRNRAGSG